MVIIDGNGRYFFQVKVASSSVSSSFKYYFHYLKLNNILGLD